MVLIGVMITMFKTYTKPVNFKISWLFQNNFKLNKNQTPKYRLLIINLGLILVCIKIKTQWQIYLCNRGFIW